MKLQKIKLNDESSSRVLEELDNIRFEHPLLKCEDCKVYHTPDKKSTLVNQDKTYLRGNTTEELANDIPNVFAYNVVSKIAPDKISQVFKDVHENEYLDLVSPDFHALPSDKGILASYLSNKLANWLSTKDKLKQGFLTYLEGRPPENSALGRVHNFLLEYFKQ